MRRPVALSPFPFFALLACLGCATLHNLAFTEPDVSLQEIDVVGIGLTGGTFDLVFDIWNPNDYRLRSTRIEVGIDLEGTHFGDALLDRPLDLSPANHSRVVVPVRFEWAGLGAGAKALVTRRAVAALIRTGGSSHDRDRRDPRRHLPHLDPGDRDSRGLHVQPVPRRR
jgi:hypothetical protein